MVSSSGTPLALIKFPLNPISVQAFLYASRTSAEPFLSERLCFHVQEFLDRMRCRFNDRDCLGCAAASFLAMVLHCGGSNVGNNAVKFTGGPVAANIAETVFDFGAYNLLIGGHWQGAVSVIGVGSGAQGTSQLMLPVAHILPLLHRKRQRSLVKSILIVSLGY